MDRIKFKINGREYSVLVSAVGNEVSSDMMLLDYIRDVLELRGTKYMCRRAGCGACIVSAKRPRTGIHSVNSCMIHITSCKDWEITTIEELGNRKKGYHILQQTLAKYNGSQCGYCSPGWVMSMYSLLQSKNDLTMMEIERSLGSNICRCTGYRPILEAFKTFAKDAPRERQILDIEDLGIYDKTRKVCDKVCDEDDWCIISKDDVDRAEVITITLLDGRRWYRVNQLNSIIDILKKEGADSYQLVAGNTAKGVYVTDETPKLLIDISGVQELKGWILDQNLVIGAGATLSELLEIYKTLSQNENFSYMKAFYEHMKMVAHVAVRNIGTIAGNLMIKHQHHEFQSDLFLMFETVAAQMTVLNYNNKRVMTMQEFLNYDMRGAVILNIMLPPLNADYKVTTFKVMPRSQNALAIVNAGFLYKYKEDVVESARIVFDGLSARFSRGSSTERFLQGKSLFTNQTLQAAIKLLDKELVATEMPPAPSAAYRKRLAIGLFYKGLLSICPKTTVCDLYRSGAVSLRESRPVSDGKQFFDTKPDDWPVTQPMPKIEALIQCAGEAKYTDDIPKFPHEVYGSFVLASVGRGKIVSIDPTKALSMHGVIAFYSAKDIPGLNSFTPRDDPKYQIDEEVFCSGEVRYCSQPIGVIVAETRHIADVAAKHVQVQYVNTKEPIIDVKEAKKDPNRNIIIGKSEATEKGDDVVKVVKGNNTIYAQYHFTLETLVCVTVPSEEGFHVYATAQWMDGMQVMIARALNIDVNRVDVHVRRLGGAFGIKISRSIQTAVACSLVAQKLNRPCRIIQSMSTTAKAMGKKFPCSSDFEVGVNTTGEIQYVNYNVYEDNGFTINEKLAEFGVDVFNNCYDKSRWNYRCFNTTTDTPKNTWFRAPGTMETIAMTELMLEQIAYELAIDPLQLRLTNLSSDYNELKTMLETFKRETKYIERKAKVNKFNIDNRWKKQGLRFSLMRYHHIANRYFDVNMNVYHWDGTVAITHGGIEIGQGINTKAAQIAAHILKIPLEKIQIKANNTVTAPNCSVTGGSLTSQNIGIGVERCCQELLKRLEPIRNKMINPTWEQLIKKAYQSNVDLQTHGFVNANDVVDYHVYGIALAEVEIDILTGESEVLRLDVMEDAGQSVNPDIDVGQVEGAIVMGLGYWLTEELVFNKNTGELLTDSTWNYFVPQARDIPQDLRVYFRKNSYSDRLILGSKSIGEPPLCVSVAIPLALREAISLARAESGIPITQWFNVDGPYTVEKICMASATKVEDMKFH